MYIHVCYPSHSGSLLSIPVLRRLELQIEQRARQLSSCFALHSVGRATAYIRTIVFRVDFSNTYRLGRRTNG